MKLVIQRVKYAAVTIDGEIYGKINKGLLVFIGIGKEDTKETADTYINKLVKMRIFEDEKGKTNLALEDVDGELLLISQFTLYADCKKGNRPSFTDACEPNKANELYEYFIDKCKVLAGESKVKTGSFGADMKVELLNDGPFTIILDENILK